MEKHLSGMKVESWVVAAGRLTAPGDPLNVPLVPASNYTMGNDRIYARIDGTATWEALEEVVGGLEGGEAVSFASGMAAVSAVFDQLPVGAVVAIPDDCYLGVAALAARGAEQGRWQLRRIAVDDTVQWIQACAEADLIWLESPSNPLLKVADLEAICQAPRKPGAILAVDNTFATPLNQQPLELGATVSIHSATKFIGGHSDLLAGIAITREEMLLEALRTSRKLHGSTPGSLEAFLATRGIRTLAVRLKRAQESAMELAKRLEAHPLITKVRYPGLPSHPNHEVAKRLLKGFGTMISFDLEGDAAFADRVCRNLRLIRHATSLGAVESTIERRAALPGQEHLPPTLLRLSIGIEHPDDLWADLEQAIEASRA